MTKSEEAAVLAFLDRIINGSKLDEHSHDDDSLAEVSERLRHAQPWSAKVCRNLHNDARSLRKILIGV